MKLPNNAVLLFSVPIGDTASSIATAKSIAGRNQDEKEKIVVVAPPVSMSLYSFHKKTKTDLPYSN